MRPDRARPGLPAPPRLYISDAQCPWFPLSRCRPPISGSLLIGPLRCDIMMAQIPATTFVQDGRKIRPAATARERGKIMPALFTTENAPTHRRPALWQAIVCDVFVQLD